jgi:hypothetical protein
MTTLEIIAYYANLLILQYLGRPKASAMVGATVTPILLPDYDVQALTFVELPTSGQFQFHYNGVDSSPLFPIYSAGTLQTTLNAILPAPLTCTITGTFADGFVITFANTSDGLLTLSIVGNTLLDTHSAPVTVTLSPIGVQLPLQIQSAFNLTGSDTAIGVQLDIIGKYVGVTRTGVGFNGPITLDDADFLTLIQMGIIRNRSGSSLLTIQLLLNQFFAGQVYVFDYANMQMSYLINTGVGSQDLIDLFVTEGLLPRPMGVGLSVIAAPVINKFFGFGSYSADPSPLVTPFNSYSAYDTSWLFMTYQDAVPH